MTTKNKVTLDIGEHLEWLAKVADQVRHGNDIPKDVRLQAKRWASVRDLLLNTRDGVLTDGVVSEALSAGDRQVLHDAANVCRKIEQALTPNALMSWTKADVTQRVTVLKALLHMGAFVPEIEAEVRKAVEDVEAAFPRRTRRTKEQIAAEEASRGQ
jgi:hypothetical protein